MKRFPVSPKKDKKVFTRTAQDVHSVNFMYARPLRGGRRM